ncbi:Mbeg1-like protein [Rheinheimera sp. NSM]|uniref:Mbeg1-like protein n=1 Tax=Rheinheimera sp. NSM TaxID=3457884 RepID=UPI00403615FD
MLDRHYDGVILQDKWGKTYLCSNCLLAYADLGEDCLSEVKDLQFGRYFLHDLEPHWNQREIWAQMYRHAKPWQCDLSKLTTFQLRDALIKMFAADEMRVWQLTEGWGQPPEDNGIGEGGLAPATGSNDSPAPATRTAKPGGAVVPEEAATAGIANHHSATLPDTALDRVQLRQLRYQQRQSLLSDTAGIPDVQQAHERLSFNNDNILRAEAAEYVYKVDEFNRGALNVLPEAPPGLEIINPEDIGLTQADFTNKQTGFGAALFKSEINGETMLTYRGTNNAVTGKEDWLTNLKQGSGLETEQYNQAMRLATQAEDIYGSDFSIVGHSLGGGLASAGVAVTGQPGYTFNSAGLHPKTASRQNGLSLADTAKLITTQAVNGEILTMAQSLGAKAVIAGAAAAIGGPITGLLAAIGITAFSALPKASGTMLDLPSVKGGNPITRHGMDQVIQGIEAQKDEDIKTLSNFSQAYNG